jgi:hypothetical protein
MSVSQSRTSATCLLASLLVAFGSHAVACSDKEPSASALEDAGAVPDSAVPQEASSVEPPPVTDAATAGDSGPACSADLSTDPKNCGRCGHDCFGGACSGGRCEARVIGTDLGSVYGLAVSREAIYATSFSRKQLFSCTAPCPNGLSPFASGRGELGEVAFDATSVYFTDWGAGTTWGFIRKCLLPNCTGGPIDVATGFLNPMRLLALENRLYWTSDYQTTLYSASVGHTGTAPPPLQTVPDTRDTWIIYIAVTRDRVFWSNLGQVNAGTGAIRSCTLPDCAGGPQTLAEGLNSPQRPTVANDTLLWTSPNAIMQCALPGCIGGAKQLLGNLVVPTALAVGGSRLYWTTPDGLYTCPLPSCATPARVAPNPTNTPPNLVRGGVVATNGTVVVWDNAGGTVQLVAAP